MRRLLFCFFPTGDAVELDLAEVALDEQCLITGQSGNASGNISQVVH